MPLFRVKKRWKSGILAANSCFEEETKLVVDGKIERQKGAKCGCGSQNWWKYKLWKA